MPLLISGELTLAVYRQHCQKEYYMLFSDPKGLLKNITATGKSVILAFLRLRVISNLLYIFSHKIFFLRKLHLFMLPYY